MGLKKLEQKVVSYCLLLPRDGPWETQLQEDCISMRFLHLFPFVL
jgi:hypothetical protein